jgi:hypothetical protein
VGSGSVRVRKILVHFQNFSGNKKTEFGIGNKLKKTKKQFHFLDIFIPKLKGLARSYCTVGMLELH